VTASGQTARGIDVPVLRVSTADGRDFRFTQSFYVGRDPACEVQIQDVHVSRRHVMVSVDGGQWSLRDLQSSNGVFVNGQRVTTASIDGSLTITLGADGPTVQMEREAPPVEAEPPPPFEESSGETMLLGRYADRYFGSAGESDEEVGPRTLMIRKAFEKVQKQQKRKHRWIVSVVALAGLLAGGYAYYGHRQMSRQQAVAEELFYAMKTLDVDIAKVEQLLASSGQAQSEQVRKYMEQRQQMENNYDRFVSSVYDRRLTEQERLILRVTRTFGECELGAPSEYLREVQRYISRWQSTGRFARAAKLAQDLGYTTRIAQEFLGQNLPPQFFYLAMQESDFEPFRSGPPTRFGYAKGMWQFIPETARRYGLEVGPLSAFPKPDPKDDRHNWEKSTRAAAKYIKDIYATDAQASGLLVMASYNWGEQRVINLIRTLPPNPRERNFWKLLERYRERLPVETYDYVFYIVSAAVIGENPRLFGFQFDSPLAFLRKG
jgi:pSer/pThr/pTyr-binding forkhead associated (FHA) protein